MIKATRKKSEIEAQGGGVGKKEKLTLGGSWKGRCEGGWKESTFCERQGENENTAALGLKFLMLYSARE